jgi:hypothetical protein
MTTEVCEHNQKCMQQYQMNYICAIKPTACVLYPAHNLPTSVEPMDESILEAMVNTPQNKN